MEEMIVRNIEPNLETLNRYSGKPIAIFDIYRVRQSEKKRKKKPSLNKIAVGILNNAIYKSHTVLYDKNESERYQENVNRLTLFFNYDTKTPKPFIFYPSRNKFIVSGGRGGVSSLDIPASENGNKFEFTICQDEFESKAKQIAYKENEEFQMFLKYSQVFWYYFK